MKALVYNGPENLSFSEVSEPKAQPGEVIVNIEAVGICGSDMHAYLGHDERRPPPLILGHEACGVIAEGPREGDRVVINPLVTCGACMDCVSGRTNLCSKREIISMPPRQGAFAEKLRIPERNLFSIPSSLNFDLAALAEPLATSWHAVFLSSKSMDRPVSEASALVLGSGAVGLGAALILKSFGCKNIAIAETNPRRRETALKAGFENIINPTEPSDFRPGFINLVIDAVGNKKTREFAISSVRPGGTITHIGLADGVDGFDARRLTLQEISFIGSYTYTPIDFQLTLDAMATGSLGPLSWSETRELKSGAKAFQDLLAGKTAAAKIILVN